MQDNVYIIGGGSSLQGFPFHQLQDADTIAVNMAAMDVPNPTYCITADSGIFRKLCKNQFKDINTTWVLVTNPEHAAMKYRDGKFIHENTGYVYNLFKPNMVIRNSGTEGIGFEFNNFKTGYNSGFCGFQLAVLLGYKKIYLLGFDLVESLGKTHYHDRYRNRKISSETLEKFHINFVKALETVKLQTNIEVISNSNISRLNKVIPYLPFTPPVISRFKAPRDVEASLAPLKGVKTRFLPPRLPTASSGANTSFRLSILICSLEGRENLLYGLLSTLKKQLTDEVEVIIETDAGEITTGAKRNRLLESARGDYIAFVDDDDLVSDDYVSKILAAIKTNPDCCGIEGIIRFKKKCKQNTFIHSIKYNQWFQKQGIYYRCPNHLSPVKRELALQVKFPDKTVGEDKDYSKRLFPLLKTEVYIKNPIYFYLTG